MTTKEIKAGWAARVKKWKDEFNPTASMQFRVPRAEIAQVLKEGAPESFKEIEEAVKSDRMFDHVLLWPEQMEYLIDYAHREASNSKAADVPG